MLDDTEAKIDSSESEEAFLKRVYRDFRETLWRTKFIIFAYCFLVVLTAVALTLGKPSYYKATATILVDSNMVQDPAERNSLSNLDLQAAIIKSPEVIDRVIEKTNLLADPIYDESTNPRDVISTSMEIIPDAVSKTIKVSFVDTRPDEAAVIANEIAQGYLYVKVTKTSGVSTESLGSLKSRVAEEMEKLNTVKTKIAEINKANPDLGNESVITDQIKFLNNQYIQMDAHRMQVKTTLAEMESLIKYGGKIENHPFFASHPRVKAKLDKLRDAELEVLQLKQEYREQHPLVMKAQTKYNVLQQSLEEEKTKILDELRSDLQSSETTLKQVRENILQLQTKDKELTPQKLLYKNLLTEEASVSDTIRLLNNQISKSSVEASYKQAGIEILSYATAPSQPFSPNKPRTIMLALLFSIFSSIGFVFLRCYTDHTIKKEEDVEQILRKPFLGQLPFVKLQKDSFKPNLKNEKDRIFFSNFLRLVCANINFLISDSHHKASLMVTSSNPGEGKSFFTYHLAHAFAQEGRLTALLDVDFCRSALSFAFPPAPAGQKGLHHYLMEQAELEQILEETAQPNLYLIRSQEAQFSTPHALRSERMKTLLKDLKNYFDVIILDAPPVLAVNDALALGEIVDMRIFVIEWGKTPKEMVQRALSKLAPSNLVRAGVILNKVKHYGGSYYYSHYYYSPNKEKKHKPK